MTRALLLAGLLAGTSVPSAAQSPHARLALDRLRDSLTAVSDTGGLRRAYREPSRHRTRTSLDQLRAGLLALRLAELGADPDASEALRRLARVAGREPGWPVAWHALGLADAIRAAWEQEDRLALGSRVGVGRLERAADRHLRALEADPAYEPAALALAGITLGLRDTGRFEEARAALRDAVAASSEPSPELLLASGRLERVSGHSDAAIAAFERYVRSGGDRATGLLEIARTGLAAARADAESLYFAGAALDDSAAVAGYRADLVPIAGDADLVRFDRLRGPERPAWLRRFWTDRDRYEMRADGERLREHYRRLLHARRSFALTVSRRFYGPADAYRSGSEELDDRGIIYVRHGEPTDRLRPFVFGLMPNESWRYTRSDGDLLFHFSAGYDERGGGDLYDYRLVQSVLDLRGASDTQVDHLLLSRQRLSPLYGRMLNWGPFGAARSQARERGIGVASIAVGTTTDSYELRFARPLDAVADLVAVGQGARGRLAHLVFALPEDAGAEPVRVRAVAIPEDGRPPVTLDTVLRVQRRVPVGRAELELEGGRWTWRAAISGPDSAGVVLRGDTVEVAEGTAPSLSDLALGVPGAATTWSPAPGDTVRLTPLERFPAAGEVDLYYEARGVATGRSYRHAISVFRMKGEPAAPERRPVVSLAFVEPASGEVHRSHRTLQLRRFKPGRYLVEVRLTDPVGASMTRRRELRLVNPR